MLQTPIRDSESLGSLPKSLEGSKFRSQDNAKLYCLKENLDLCYLENTANKDTHTKDNVSKWHPLIRLSHPIKFIQRIFFVPLSGAQCCNTEMKEADCCLQGLCSSHRLFPRKPDIQRQDTSSSSLPGSSLDGE